MKKAIITGSTGLVASSVVEYLLENDIKVLALGRRKIKYSRIKHLSSHPNLRYIQVEMSKIEKLPQLLREINWSTDSNCVFYHFAWSGNHRLTDGNIQDQFNNVTYSSNALIIAKELGCKSFINAGSQEEKYIDSYLSSKWSQKVSLIIYSFGSK